MLSRLAHPLLHLQVLAAINEVRADPKRFDFYQNDRQVMDVMGKIRRVHAVCNKNGQRTVAIEAITNQPNADFKVG